MLLRATLFLALALAASGCHADEAEDVRRNDAIAAELPMFPFAERLDSYVYPFEDPEGGDAAAIDHAEGYVSRYTYAVPETTTPLAIVRFYDRELRGEWRQSPGTLGPSSRCYRRDDAVMELEATLLETGDGRLEYALDVSGKPGAIPGCA